MSAPVRVLYVHHRSELGGAPTSLYYLIRELDRTRFEPHVYCPPGAAAELFRDAGAVVHTGPVAGFTHIWASVYRGRRWALLARELLRLPAHLLRFRRTLRNGSFDVVHVNDSPPVAAAWLARRAGIPVVWHLRSALPRGGDDRRSRLLRRAIRRLASDVVAINDDVAAAFHLDAAVIPNPVDLDLFSPGDRRAARASLDLEPDGAVVSYFGFLYPAKGFHDFIEAAALLRARGTDATFLVVGGGVRSREFFRSPTGRLLELLDLAPDYERQARERVTELGLGDAVRFVPFTRNPEALYRASDLVVAPSRGPELGRPVIEAAATGVPVVASGSASGGRIVLPGRTGSLVPSADPAAVADAVASLLADDGYRGELGRAAREHAEREFSPAVSARRAEALYERVLSRVPVLYVPPRDPAAAASLAALARRLDDRFEPVFWDHRRVAGLRIRRLARLRRVRIVHFGRGGDRLAARLVHSAGARVVADVGPVGRETPPGADALVAADGWLLRHADGLPCAVVVPAGPRSGTRRSAAATPSVGLVPAGRVAADWEQRDFDRAVRLARGFGASLEARVPLRDEDAADYLAGLDIAVVPSHSSPAAAAAAAAAGCAVVAASSPGGGPLAGAAIVTPPRSPAALAAAVASLAADPAERRRLADAAAARADVSAAADRLAGLYEEVLAL